MSKKSVFLLGILLSMVGTKTMAYDIEAKNAKGVTIYYNYINNGTELEVSRGNYSGVVAIPNEVTFMNRTRKVTSIEGKAFYNCQGLTSVTIPNNVTTIGSAAFMYCSSLISVTIGNSVTNIEDCAFQECSNLASVKMGNNVTKIGDRAFHKCHKLTSITIPNSVTSIGIGTFLDCI